MRHRVSGALIWLRLVEGYPPPQRYARDHTLRGPLGFLKAFYRELIGVDLPGPVEQGSKEDAGSWERRGRFGTADTGLSWLSYGLTDDGSFFDEYYRGDLPAVRFHWHATFTKSGYGHIPHHDDLVVEFADAGIDRCFRRVWKDVFGEKPQFTRTATPRDPGSTS